MENFAILHKENQKRTKYLTKFDAKRLKSNKKMRQHLQTQK